MEYLILGPLEVRSEHGTLPLGGRQPRAVLTVLLLSPNQVVSAERLALALWGEDAPNRATKTVHVLISRLRKALGDPDLVVTTAAGYRLRVGPGELDAERFDSLVADASEELAAGRPERAATVLREALALWRGPPLAEFAFEPFAQGEIARLEEQRLTALETLAEAELRAGRHVQLVGELQQLASANPLRERFAELLMRALYRCGRQAEALDVYNRARRELDEQLGLEPGPALKTLQAQVLEQSPALDLAAPRAAASLPLPPALRAVPATAYVGRDRERAQLGEVVNDARIGARRVVLLGGEPGVGKTRLAAHASLDAAEAGFAVSWGASVEDLSAPYAVWIDALSHLVEHAPEELLARHVAQHGGEIARLVPSLARRLTPAQLTGQSDPEMERWALFGAVVRLLEALCAARPATLVLDDLQWADTQSLALLKYVAAATGDLPLLIIGTYRDSDLPPSHPLRGMLADLRGVPGVLRMQLVGLAIGEVAELITGIAGHEIGPDGLPLAAEITEESDGNPFFVGQILRHMRESGAVEEDDRGRWIVRMSIAELGLPPSVHEVVARRVERLGGDAQTALTVAAVIGRSFDVELLERLLDIDDEPLLAALEAATAGAVLVASTNVVGRYSFTHALINHSLYDTLSPLRQSRLHCRVAQALEALAAGDPGERLSELARHWFMAKDPAHAGKAVHYARLAGERALDELAPDEAIRWFTRALERLVADEPQRCDVLIGLGEAQRQVGDSAFRDTLLEASAIAERLGDDDRLTRAVLANTLGPFGSAGRRDERRIATLERTLAALPGSPYRARMLAVLAKELYFSGEPVRGTQLAEDALALARGRSDRRELARVMALTTSISPITPLEAHLALVRELAGFGEEFRDRELRFRAANALFIYAMHSGDAVQLATGLSTMLELAEAIGQPILTWTALWCHSAQQAIAGDLARAEQLVAQSEEVAAEHNLRGVELVTFGQRIAIYTEQDRLEELAEQAERHAADNPRIRLLRLTPAFIAAETGRREEAAAVLAETAAGGFAFPYDRTRAFNLARCADIALRVGEHSHAAELYERLLTYRQQFATAAGISSRGSIELSLGRLASVLGRPETAHEHFAAAERAHMRLGAPLLQARGALAWGEALLARDPARAAELLRRAIALARRHGSSAIERESTALLAERAVIPGGRAG